MSTVLTKEAESFGARLATSAKDTAPWQAWAAMPAIGAGIGYVADKGIGAAGKVITGKDRSPDEKRISRNVSMGVGAGVLTAPLIRDLIQRMRASQVKSASTAPDNKSEYLGQQLCKLSASTVVLPPPPPLVTPGTGAMAGAGTLGAAGGAAGLLGGAALGGAAGLVTRKKEDESRMAKILQGALVGAGVGGLGGAALGGGLGAYTGYHAVGPVNTQLKNLYNRITGPANVANKMRASNAGDPGAPAHVLPPLPRK